MLRFFQPPPNSCAIDDVSFYFESDRFGMSDNHRMAYWFFARKAVPGSTLLHVDTHVDCSHFRPRDRAEMVKVDATGCIEKFVEHRYRDGLALRSPVRWGNWIPALLSMHPELFNKVCLVCHEEATRLTLNDLPCVEEEGEKFLWTPDGLRGARTCLSFDVDYYFERIDDVYSLRDGYSDPLPHFEQCLRQAHACSRLPLFVALSPTCCGGSRNVLPFVDSVDRIFALSIRKEIEARLMADAAGRQSREALSRC